ncbi:phosphoglycerate dehydrogenase [Rubellimicrobium roseum]|uniref:Oxidoreductase n=1 Tax=Rubellimicrobium roseum TaxID=687525 RepID=A0A5C4NJ71_9RHOB|nr:phosphoglycerate dehydrogenase [Rubellimicrobium roseum]TNC72747.1 oxidoreductase [Rubellimicrobium roseum]
MDRILVTPRSLTSAPPPALDRLVKAGFELVFSTPGATPSEAELLRLVPGCVGWLAGVEPVSEAVIVAADRLRIISRNGTGADNLPHAALTARGIKVARAMGANATGVAELAVGLILSACRHIPETAAGIHSGGWPRLKGREIEGTTVGIVGLGAIGHRVARAMDALGARLLVHDPFRPDPKGLNIEFTDLVGLLERAEIVSLHCPAPENGCPLLDAEALARLPRGAILVNTARANLVGAEALLAALDEGRIGTYATDVFAVEPPAGDRLATHHRVLATSHIGALTDGSVARATEAAVENLLLALHAPADATG